MKAISRGNLRLAFAVYICVLLTFAGFYSTDAAAQICCEEQFGLVVSTSADRSAATVLEGATVSGTIYVFMAPLMPVSSIKKVRWYMDKTITRANILSNDSAAPYDFQGGTVAMALPFDTTTLADGIHTISIKIVYNGSPTVREDITTTFTVNNSAPPPPPPGIGPYEFGVAEMPDRIDAAAELMPLPDGMLELLFGRVFIFIGDTATCTMTSCLPITVDTTIAEVTFTFDIGIPGVELVVNTDMTAPFDMDEDGADPANNGFNLDALPEGPHTLTATITLTDASVVILTRTFLSQPLIAALPPTLKGVPVPVDPQLAPGAGIIADLDAAIALGRAFYWDLQTGSNGRQACATCHYHSGIDNRILNTVNPGANGTFDVVAGPGETLIPASFNFHQFADPLNRNSAITKNVDAVVGSQGLVQLKFEGVNEGSDRDSSSPPVMPDLRFVDGDGKSHPRVTRRQTPTNINAIFNVRSFWDGRANFVFNGQSPFGARDPSAVVYVNDGLADAPPVTELLRILFASLASQSVGPPTDPTEMSYNGRTFPELGRKLLALRPLAKQMIHPMDSVFGTPGALTGIINAGGMGLDDTHMYKDLIEMAFAPRYWNGGGVVIDQVTYKHIEANFAMFWGLAIMSWQATLVSDDSPYDRFRDGTPEEQQDKVDAALLALDTGIASLLPDVLSMQETAGMLSFLDGECAACHAGPVLSAATVPFLIGPVPIGEAAEQVVERMLMEQGIAALEIGLPPPSRIYDFGFYNIGIRPTFEDVGVGGTDPWGNPLSFSRQLQTGLHVDAGLNAGDPGVLAVDTCLFAIAPCATALGVPVAVNGAFKVPTLRNIDLTAPYMHNGGHVSLTDVVAFYARGADFFDENIVDLDPEVAGIGNLRDNPVGVAALVAFLRTFTDPDVREEAGKFDHPSILLENGVFVDAVGINGNGAGSALPTYAARLTGPTARADSYDTPTGAALMDNLLVNDTDGDGSGIVTGPVMIAMEGPANGMVTVLASNGDFTYEPDVGFRGVDGFAYDVKTTDDLDPRSNVARVKIQVGDQVPVANPDMYATDINTPLTVAAGIGVLFNDTDDAGPLTAIIVAGPSSTAALILNPDGSFTYTPVMGFTGPDTFTYTADDPSGPSNVATVTIDVGTAAVPCPADGVSRLCYSLSADRSTPLLLDGATLSGPVYIFISPLIPLVPPDSTVKKGVFWVDDPDKLLGATKFNSDTAAPYDFNDGTVATADPFTAGVAPLTVGMHTIRAQLRFIAGGVPFEVLPATIMVE